MANRQVELQTMLHSLRLPTMAEVCADLALKSAKEDLSHEAFLYELARLECERSLLDSSIPRVVMAKATTPRETLERATAAYFEFVERRGQQWTVLFGGAGRSGYGAAEAEQLRFATVSRIRDLVVALEPAVDPVTAEAFAHAISGSAEQVAKWWRANPQLAREDVLARQTAFAWGGLGQLFPEPQR